MKKFLRVLKVIINSIAFVLLLFSFPVKSYYGQNYCDLMRLFGFGLMFISYIIIPIVEKTQDEK